MVVVGGLVLLGLAARAGAEDWPRWRGVRGDGSWQAPPLAERWPDGGLKRVWRQPIAGGYAGVIVADGRVYTLDRQKEPAEVERILCFDAAQGTPLWTHTYPVRYGDMAYGSGPRAAPTVAEGRVYTLGALGQACCLDAATGKLIWAVDARERYQARVPEWGFAASPVVWRDLVVLHVAAQPGGCFLALERAGGALRWKASDDPAGYATPIVIERSDGDQLVGWTPSHIVGIEPMRGRVEWQVPYEVTYGVSIATPIYCQGLVFVAGYWDGSKAIRLGAERTDALLAWEDKKLLRGLMSQPLVRKGHAYLLEKQFGVTCFELSSGKKLWDDDNKLTPRGRNPQASIVWLGASDRVLALNAEGELVLARFRPQGYEELARARIIGPTWAHPAFAGSRVFARNDAELICVELPLAENRSQRAVTE